VGPADQPWHSDVKVGQYLRCQYGSTSPGVRASDKIPCKEGGGAQVWGTERGNRHGGEEHGWAGGGSEKGGEGPRTVSADLLPEHVAGVGLRHVNPESADEPKGAVHVPDLRHRQQVGRGPLDARLRDASVGGCLPGTGRGESRCIAGLGMAGP